MDIAIALTELAGERYGASGSMMGVYGVSLARGGALGAWKTAGSPTLQQASCKAGSSHPYWPIYSASMGWMHGSSARDGHGGRAEAA